MIDKEIKILAVIDDALGSLRQLSDEAGEISSILNCIRYNRYMSDRSQDWIKQSLRDLDQARDSQKAGRHEWACFAAHQAAEKAVKALHLSLKQEAWGHVVNRLLIELPASIAVTQDLLDKANVLDSFYIPTRYANGHPEGAPYEHYGRLQSEQAINYASEIIEFARLKMA